MPIVLLFLHRRTLQKSIRKVAKPQDTEHLSEVRCFGNVVDLDGRRASLQGFCFPPIDYRGQDIQTPVQLCFQSSAPLPILPLAAVVLRLRTVRTASLGASPSTALK
jgi:hypothetical protein